MSAGYSNLYINQGETFSTIITLTDENFLPYNLNGTTVTSHAKKSYYSSNASLVFDAEILDANNGIVQLSAPYQQTSNLKPGILVYDVVLKQNTAGNISRVLEGQIIVNPGVTILQ